MLLLTQHDRSFYFVLYYIVFSVIHNESLNISLRWNLLLRSCVYCNTISHKTPHVIAPLFTLQPAFIPASWSSCGHIAAFVHCSVCSCQRANIVSAHCAKPSCLFDFTTLGWISEVYVCVCVFVCLERQSLVCLFHTTGQQNKMVCMLRWHIDTHTHRSTNISPPTHKSPNSDCVSPLSVKHTQARTHTRIIKALRLWTAWFSLALHNLSATENYSFHFIIYCQRIKQNVTDRVCAAPPQ